MSELLTTINAEKRLYCIPAGNGVSCLGFDVVMSRGNAVAEWLRHHGRSCSGIPDDWRGTPQALHKYQRIMAQAGRFAQVSGKRCEIDLTTELIGLEGRRVEITDKHSETRRFYVGKSMGWMPCHLEIKRCDSSAGCAVTGAPFKKVTVIR